MAQQVEIRCSPVELLQRSRNESGVFLLDGAGKKSWGCGDAFFGFAPAEVLEVDSQGCACHKQGDVITPWRGGPMDCLDRSLPR